eukprot:2577594-Rhodomonas_salina.1
MMCDAWLLSTAWPLTLTDVKQTHEGKHKADTVSKCAVGCRATRAREAHLSVDVDEEGVVGPVQRPRSPLSQYRTSRTAGTVGSTRYVGTGEPRIAACDWREGRLREAHVCERESVCVRARACQAGRQIESEPAGNAPPGRTRWAPRPGSSIRYVGTGHGVADA